MKKESVEKFADAEYDITTEGYKKAFIFMLEGNFTYAIKLLRFARKRLNYELKMARITGLGGVGTSSIREKSSNILDIINVLKKKDLDGAINAWGMGIGLPFDALMAREEFEIEIEGLKKRSSK